MEVFVYVEQAKGLHRGKRNARVGDLFCLSESVHPRMRTSSISSDL